MPPNPSWWSDSPPIIPPSTRALLETYSAIPASEVEAHVLAVRDRAYAIHAYPCIGQWRFLHLFIGEHPLYRSEILPRLLRDEGQSFLDLGCCFAQDTRRLVADGVAGERCWASDVELDFVEVGFDLFRDRERLGARFVRADVLDEGEGNALEGLRGRFDVIGASSLLHLFRWEDQKKVARRILGLLRPSDEGGLVVGRQMARGEAGDHRVDETRTVYRHNEGSWRRLWEEVAAESGGKLEVRVEVEIVLPDTLRGMGSDGEERKMMIFTVRTTWTRGSGPA